MGSDSRRANHMSRILLIDDDEGFSGLLADYLAGEGFEVEVCGDGLSAPARLLEGSWDLVILDVMLPGMSGLDVLREVRPQLTAPVLMLTARGEDTDTVVGLELGADDYVSKPVSPRVLVARMRALLRRRHGAVADEGILQVGDLVLEEGARRVTVGGFEPELTGAEFNLLALLLRNAGRPVSRERLAREGLGTPLQAYDRRVDTHMAQIRKKLGPLPDGGPRIQTIRGSGYQYVVSR